MSHSSNLHERKTSGQLQLIAGSESRSVRLDWLNSHQLAQLLSHTVKYGPFDLKVALKRSMQRHEEDVERLNREKDSNALQLNQEKEEIVCEMKAEFEGLAQKYEKEKAALINEVALVQKERDEMLVMAENEKQEVLHLAANEKAVLSEKGNRLQDELENVQAQLEKVKRESFSRAEQDKVNIHF